MGARHRGGIGFSYRPARLHRLAEFIPWNQCRGPINGLWHSFYIVACGVEKQPTTNSEQHRVNTVTHGLITICTDAKAFVGFF
jgi:hypothetical protein